MTAGDKAVAIICLVALGFLLGFDAGRIPKDCPMQEGQKVAETWQHSDRSMTCVYIKETYGAAKTRGKI